MQFVQKVENFFFPCSKQIRALMRGHESDMQDFRDTVAKAQCAVNRGGDAAASCIIDGDEKDARKKHRAAHCL